jgi:hypothetical protein
LEEPLKVPLTVKVDPSNVRFDSTVPFGELPFNVIIPLSVDPFNNNNPLVPEVPEEPDVPEEPSPPAAPSKLVIHKVKVPVGVDISVTFNVSKPVE